jgi:hypothetical protein
VCEEEVPIGTKYSTAHVSQPVVRVVNRPRTLACKVHVHDGCTQVVMLLRPADGGIEFPDIHGWFLYVVIAYTVCLMFISLLTMDAVQFVPFLVHWPGLDGYIPPVYSTNNSYSHDDCGQPWSTALSGTRSRWWVHRLMK